MKGKFSSLLSVLRLALPYWRTLLLAMLALGFASAINLALPEVIRRLLNSDSFDQLMAQPISIGGLLIGIFALQAIAFYLRTYLFGKVGHSVVFDLRKQLFCSLLKKPLAYFDAQRTGDLLSRINADTLMLQDVVSFRVSVIIRYAVQIIFGIALMAFISPKLTISIVVVVPILVLLSKSLGKKLKVLTKEQQERLGEATTSAEQAIGGIRTVKAFNGESFEGDRFEKQIGAVRGVGFSRSRFAAFFASSVNFLMNAALVAVVLLGLGEVAAGTLSAGDLTAFLLYGLIVGISFAFLAGGISELYQGAGAASRIFEVIETPDEEDLDADTFTEEIQTIAFKEVTFAYPTREDEAALQKFSCALKRGSFTALVGPSGAGKSTVVNLLLRFYDPQEGSLEVNGKPAKGISRHALREHIAIVPQDPILFADTIGSNLRYAKPEASEDELWEVLRSASLDEFVRSLPEKLETYVGERGVQLSGGQKQRLAIARALLRKPDVLILDEATSSLDSENEALIQQALSTIRKECAVLAIAHRLSTIQNADEIIVLHRGEVLQQGSHEELMQRDGMYKDFVSYQELVAA